MIEEDDEYLNHNLDSELDYEDGTWKVYKTLRIPPNLISCNYKDVVTARVRVFELTNLC